MKKIKTASIWGVGLKLFSSTGLYAIVSSLLTRFWPGTFVVTSIPYHYFVWAAIVLLGIGIPFLIVSARQLAAKFYTGALITDGLFARSRNPLYAAWILWIIPGLALLSSSSLVFLTPLISYLLFKIMILEEEEYLTNHFGQAYLDYKSRTNPLWPRLFTRS